MTISTEAIKSALSALIDPVTGTDYVSGKMFKSAETDENGNVKVFIELGYPAKHRAEGVGQAVGEAVRGGGCRFRRGERYAKHHRPQGAGYAARHAGRKKHHRRELGQGRRGQVHGFRKPSACSSA